MGCTEDESTMLLLGYHGKKKKHIVGLGDSCPWDQYYQQRPI